MGELSTLHIFVATATLAMCRTRSKSPPSVPFSIATQQQAVWRMRCSIRPTPDSPSQLTPFARPEVDIKWWIHPQDQCKLTLQAIHPNQPLRNLMGKQVLVEVKSGDKTRQVIVKPVNGARDSAEDTRYDEWEYTRRLKVDQDSLGKIGYVHLRAMGGEDIEAWARDFYPLSIARGSSSTCATTMVAPIPGSSRSFSCARPGATSKAAQANPCGICSMPSAATSR